MAVADPGFRKKGHIFGWGLRGKVPPPPETGGLGTELPEAERFAYMTANFASSFAHIFKISHTVLARLAAWSQKNGKLFLPPKAVTLNPPPKDGDMRVDHTYTGAQTRQRTHARKQSVSTATARDVTRDVTVIT